MGRKICVYAITALTVCLFAYNAWAGARTSKFTVQASTSAVAVEFSTTVAIMNISTATINETLLVKGKIQLNEADMPTIEYNSNEGWLSFFIDGTEYYRLEKY